MEIKADHLDWINETIHKGKHSSNAHRKLLEELDKDEE